VPDGSQPPLTLSAPDLSGPPCAPLQGVRLRFLLVVATTLVGCAGSSAGRFDSMTASEHTRAAARERRLADQEFARIHPEKVAPSALEAEGPAYLLGPADFGPSSDPAEPEFYTRDPRLHDRNQRHEDAARRHRERAQAHEAAARKARHTE
jgi:hypothetical protein